MEMKYLSLELLKENLEKAENCKVEDTVPEGFEEDFFKTFLKVLQSPEKELDDVPSEQLVKMLEQGEELFETLNLDDSTLGGIFTRLNATTSRITARKRRVL